MSRRCGVNSAWSEFAAEAEADTAADATAVALTAGVSAGATGAILCPDREQITP